MLRPYNCVSMNVKVAGESPVTVAHESLSLKNLWYVPLGTVNDCPARSVFFSPATEKQGLVGIGRNGFDALVRRNTLQVDMQQQVVFYVRA